MITGIIAKAGELLTSGVSETPPLNLEKLPADELKRRALLESFVEAGVVYVRGRVDEPKDVVMAIDLKL